MHCVVGECIDEDGTAYEEGDDMPNQEPCSYCQCRGGGKVCVPIKLFVCLTVPRDGVWNIHQGAAVQNASHQVLQSFIALAFYIIFYRMCSLSWCIAKAYITIHVNMVC